MYYTTIVDLSYPSVNVTICVSNYVQSFVSTYNHVNVLIHYLIPFLIQIISITILIIQIACSRVRAGGGNNQQTFVTVFKRQLKDTKGTICYTNDYCSQFIATNKKCLLSTKKETIEHLISYM